jgi:hypothetical protein
VKRGVGAAGIPPSAASAHQLGASGGGGGEGGGAFGMLTGHDHAPTSKGNDDHGWTRCCAAGLG